MKRYEAYKPTSVEWYPAIPQEWEWRYLFQIAHEQTIKKPVDEMYPVMTLSYGEIKRKKNTEAGLVPSNYDSYQMLYKGNIVLRLIDLQNDHTSLRTGLVKETGIITSAYTCIMPTENPAYIQYLLHSYDTKKVFYGYGGGVRQSIGFKDIRHLRVPVPPREEQDQIVRYLDWQVSKINRLIAVKKRQLSILAEYRKAKIDEIILHGDKQAPQKDSGIWWLRDIPQSWQLIPLKRICQVNASISNTAKQLPDEELVTFLPMESVSTTGTVDYSEKRRLGDVRSGYSSFALDDVVIAKITPCFENGKGACLDSMDTDIGYGTTEFINLRASDRILPRYLYMITMTQPFRKLGEEMMTGSAGQKRVPIEFVKGFAVGIPPIEEQARLLALLNDVTKRIDCQTKSYYESIISLQELRTRLISDVVTGQVDVRGIKVPDDEYINNEITEEEFEEESENNEEE